VVIGAFGKGPAAFFKVASSTSSDGTTYEATGRPVMEPALPLSPTVMSELKPGINTVL
jgi:hypothetical protein